MSIGKIAGVLSILIQSSFFSYAQDNAGIGVFEDSIGGYFHKIKNAANDSDKIKYNLRVYLLFKEVLMLPESYSFGFDSLKTVGKTVAPDLSFRIITWNLPLHNGTYQYFGIIQYKQKENTIKLYALTDRAGDIAMPENTVLSTQKWYGALYYKILKNKVEPYTYYTILGLRFNDLFTTTKLIEVLYFDQFDNPVFGAPLFTVQNKIQHRILFHFSARVAMNLSFNEKMNMIVFDHLSPSESKYTGQFMYYGPDFSYDGFYFKDNKWLYQANLDLKRSEATQPHTTKSSNKLR
jgi:hypothetical protein